MGDDYRHRERRGTRQQAEQLLERVRHLRLKASEDQYDVPAWEHAAEELCSLPPSDVIKATFEEILATFPTAVHLWIQYAQQEMNANNVSGVKTVFGRCLLTCPNVELWALYLRFIKRSNEGRGATGLMEVRNAYEFTLDCLGNDIGAGPLWQEYIHFLQSPKPGTEAFSALFPSSVAGQEESTRMAAVRRAYQRAVVVPSHMLEALWKQYESFELSGSKQLARKVLEEWRAKFQAARAMYRERKRKLEQLNVALLPLPPGAGGPQQASLVALWKEYLEYEKSNPQRMDTAALNARVSLAYDQCLMLLWFYPEVWFDYAHWHAEGSGGGPGQAAAVLARADKALPKCLLLRFAQADVEELAGRVEQAKQVYDALVERLEGEASAAASNRPAAGGQQQGLAGATALGHFDQEQGALIWIQYMRFLRRTGDAMAARQLFLRARRWSQAPHHTAAPWHIYAAMALMEWQFGRDSTVAAKIFEKGLEDARLFKEPDYLLEYHKFLCDVGDTDNARALFERALAEPDNIKSAPLWKRYVQFEYEQGNVAIALQVERRARTALGDSHTGALHLAVLKYQFHDAWPCTRKQRAYLEHLLGLAPLMAWAPEPGPQGHGLLPAGAGGREPEQQLLTQLPPAVAMFLNELPPPQSVELPGGEGPLLDDVMEALVAADLSQVALVHVSMELEAGRLPQPGGMAGGGGAAAAAAGGPGGFLGGPSGRPENGGRDSPLLPGPGPGPGPAAGPPSGGFYGPHVGGDLPMGYQEEPGPLRKRHRDDGPAGAAPDSYPGAFGYDGEEGAGYGQAGPPPAGFVPPGAAMAGPHHGPARLQQPGPAAGFGMDGVRPAGGPGPGPMQPPPPPPYDGSMGGPGAQGAGAAPSRDIYRQRLKQRTRMAAGDG